MKISELIAQLRAAQQFVGTDTEVGIISAPAGWVNSANEPQPAWAGIVLKDYDPGCFWQGEPLDSRLALNIEIVT